MQFDKGIGSLLRGNETQYNMELYKTLKGLQEDAGQYLSAILFFIKESYSKIPIVVLDNCDKRNKDEQLLMFEVAQWLRTQYKCLVVLPMRDTTYDMYKSEPPLDTIVRDLVFRIDPPDLLKVLQARLDYITRITEQTSSTYVLDNGIQVTVKRSELIEYFKLIMVAIRNDRWISNLFYRLTNRNTRNGIQIFEDFCKSGHMKTNDILAMRVLGEEAKVPTFRFENVLLRKNRRFYNGDESNFINIFASDYNDDFPDPFARVDMLEWLHAMLKVEGPNKDKGLFPVSSMIKSLQMYGHNTLTLRRELAYLIKKGLVFCENTGVEIRDNDLIKITISGSLHLQMASNVSYLAACAEDSLFRNTEIMMRISRRLRIRESNSKLISVLNAKDLVDYLCEYRKEYIADGKKLLSESYLVPPYDLENSRRSVERLIQSDSSISEVIEKLNRFKNGSYIKACIVSKQNGGLVCTIDNDDIKGFLSTRESIYALSEDVYKNIEIGDLLSCQIIEYDIEHRSFQLRFIKAINENTIVFRMQ